MDTLTQNELIFARNLDEKLHLIQDKENNLYPVIYNDLTIKNLKNNKNMLKDQRPQFVTTVRKGVFLEPPPEVAALLGLSPAKSSVNSPHSSSSVSCASTATAATQAQTVIMYSYSSKPKVLNKSYHTECKRTVLNNARDGATPYGNLMYDRRVVRGSNYGNHPTPNGDDIQAKQREARRRAQARRRARGCSSKMRQGTPPPVPGRKHEPVQTERYLEELLDRPPEAEASCQTDLFLDLPLEPPYIDGTAPSEDKETQIYPGDLFDFEYEVAPLIENIVLESLEKGLVEVLEEEEYMDIQVQQRRLQEIRALEELQQQHLEAELDYAKEQQSTDRTDVTNVISAVIMKLQSEGIPINESDLEWLIDSLNNRLNDPGVIEVLTREILEEAGKFQSETPPGETEELNSGRQDDEATDASLQEAVEEDSQSAVEENGNNEGDTT